MHLRFPKIPLFKIFSKIGFYPIVLFVVVLIICIKNYTPGTFLTGWDTLHPEFNLGLYWKRILGGVWQEHQGLGAVASQSHAAEIPRMLLLTVLDVIVGMKFVRYAYAFLMLFFGAFGVYFFLKDVFLQKFEKAPKLLGAFLGSLFYVLNLGTLQHFYVPLEMFLTHFGLLGWYMWSSSQYYQTGRRKYLALFFGFTLFGSSQAHTSTLFYAYFIYFFAYFLIVLLTDLSQKFTWNPEYIKRTGLIFVFMLFTNFFWLLPNFYFAANHGGEVNMSKIHSLFSNEAFLANKKYGGTQDVTILRSFLFSWGEHTGNAQYGELLDEWILHLSSPGVLLIGYSFFVLACVGVLASILRKEKFGYAAFAFFAIGIFFLFNVNPPFGSLFTFLQEHVPLFKEAFRFPFTKFSIGLMFSYAVFFAYALSWYSSLFHKITSKILLPRFVRGIIVITTSVLIVYFMWSAFSGHLISPSMRVNIPDRYFKMFEYFDSQDSYGRVADFPVHSFWGWMYYNWEPARKTGYQGAGFLWFGIKQPLLNREFDRWNLLNEQYYREISYAVYSRDPEKLTEVLDKYKVRWLLLDESVMVPAADSKQLFYEEIKDLFARTGLISLARDFGDGLYVYEYDSGTAPALVESYSTFYPVGDEVYKEPYDPIYREYKPYVSGGEESFPYVGITQTDETVSPEYIRKEGNVIYINPKFVTGGAALSAAEGGEPAAYIPLTANVTRTSDSVVVSVSQVASGEDIWSYTFTDISIADPVVVAINGDSHGLFFAQNEVTSKELSFYYHMSNPSVDMYSGQDNSKRISNFVDVYTMKQADVPVRTYSGELEPCSDLHETSSYEVEWVENGFVLTGDAIKACLTLPVASVLGELSGDPSFAEPYVITAEVEPPNPYAICVFSNKSGLCENYYRDGAHTFVLKGAVSDYFLRFISNSLGAGTALSTTFKNIKIVTVEGKERVGINLTSDQVLIPSVSEPYKIDPGMTFGGPAVSLDHYYRYCNLLANQENIPDISAEPGLITYSSPEDAICDSFPFPYLSQNTGYLLEIRAKNVAGAPLRVCLTNELSKRCDLYVELPKSPDLESYYYFIPPMGAGTGYTVNFSNLVFGNDFTENKLESVRLTPVPYSYLRGFHTQVSQNQESTLIVLNEAYEEGWTAFCGITPCKANHVKVNNWANGWVFEGQKDMSGVKFVFWPEYLEYLGFLFLIPLGFVLFRSVPAEAPGGANLTTDTPQEQPTP